MSTPSLDRLFALMCRRLHFPVICNAATASTGLMHRSFFVANWILLNFMSAVFLEELYKRSSERKTNFAIFVFGSSVETNLPPISADFWHVTTGCASDNHTQPGQSSTYEVLRFELIKVWNSRIPQPWLSAVVLYQSLNNAPWSRVGPYITTSPERWEMKLIGTPRYMHRYNNEAWPWVKEYLLGVFFKYMCKQQHLSNFLHLARPRPARIGCRRGAWEVGQQLALSETRFISFIIRSCRMFCFVFPSFSIFLIDKRYLFTRRC